MSEPKCASDCREDLQKEINGKYDDLLRCLNNKIPKSMIWKATLLFFLVWGVAFGIYAGGLQERKDDIKENRKNAQLNKEAIIEINGKLNQLKAQLDGLEKGQATILKALQRHMYNTNGSTSRDTH